MADVIPFRAEPTDIDGLLIVRMKQVTDERGTIRELFRLSAFAEAGAASLGPWLQVNVTETSQGASGKVVTVPLVKGTQVLVPPGVCNGFQSVSPGVSQYLYCFDAEWVPGMSGVAVNPLDPDLGIVWPIPVDRALVSAKDAGLPPLRDVLG